MRVLVCGGRNYRDAAILFRALDRLDAERRISCVIHGAAPGADSLASAWAQSRGVDQEPFPADWRQHGRAAGPLRNAIMLAEGKPDLVVALPGGRGTADCVRQAERACVPVRLIEPHGDE